MTRTWGVVEEGASYSPAPQPEVRCTVSEYCSPRVRSRPARSWNAPRKRPQARLLQADQFERWSALGGGQITVRLHQDNDDRRRKFNRTENVRPIPPSDPDFPRLYGRRNDSESLNRSLEDTLFLCRAHSLGWRRQQVEMLGWAVMVNALTMARHRTAEGLEAAA